MNFIYMIAFLSFCSLATLSYLSTFHFLKLFLAESFNTNVMNGAQIVLF